MMTFTPFDPDFSYMKGYRGEIVHEKLACEPAIFWREEGPIYPEKIENRRVRLLYMSDHSIIIKMGGHYYTMTLDHLEVCDGCSEE